MKMNQVRYFLEEEDEVQTTEKSTDESVSTTIKPDTKFWIVTEPTEDSTLADVLFSTDIRGLVLQIKGGLAASQIHGIYLDEDVATADAMDLVPAPEK
jgi:hypothetical protein